MECKECEDSGKCSREATESYGKNGRERYCNAREAWEAIGFNVIGKLSYEKIQALEISLAEKLERLEPSEYAPFCIMANNELRICQVMQQTEKCSLESIINLPDWHETYSKIVTSKKPGRFWGSIGLREYFIKRYLEKKAEQEELAMMIFENQARDFIGFVKHSS